MMTLRALGLSCALVAGMTMGALAASPDTGTPSATTQAPSSNAAPGTYRSPQGNQVTTNPGDKVVTSDGRVGAAAPSAGGKVGGGQDSGSGGGSTGGASSSR
jgi:hypothetical protein